ncbi:MAG: glycosyltransferase family 2 protein [Lachnospiraceae bacterium]|nr:glycosyltransferase family 2 protein [Lachnospiraceae bacterium]
MTERKSGLVSIVVPVYNAEKFLEETIGCVQAQTYTKWELLLVDDCSTDGSRALIETKEKEDGRIRLVAQRENGGAAKARNRGIKEAAGQYLCFLDADDIWLPDKLGTEVEVLRTIQKMNPQAGFVFMGYEFADESGRGLGKIVHVPEQITYRQALKNTTIFTSTVMIDRKIIPDEDILMPCVASEDTAAWWQILKKHGAGYGIDRNLVKYRRSENTLSSNKLAAVERIWRLYRRQEKLSVIQSAYCMLFWACRAVLRRI